MKVTLPTISSGYLSVDALSTALSEIEVAFENTLSRDGSTPNEMEADLDMNGYAILNASTDTSDDSSLVTYGAMTDYVDERSSGVVIQRVEEHTAIIGQVTFILQDMEYEVGANNLAVYVNGVRKFAGTHYTEAATNAVVFADAFTDTDDVTFVTNEFLSTVSVEAHTHTWGDLEGVLPDYATRWPTYAEVTGKPTTFTPADHEHGADDITSGRLADARRGVYVQENAPTGLTEDDAGVLHFW